MNYYLRWHTCLTLSSPKKNTLYNMFVCIVFVLSSIWPNFPLKKSLSEAKMWMLCLSICWQEKSIFSLAWKTCNSFTSFICFSNSKSIVLLLVNVGVRIYLTLIANSFFVGREEVEKNNRNRHILTTCSHAIIPIKLLLHCIICLGICLRCRF